MHDRFLESFFLFFYLGLHQDIKKIKFEESRPYVVDYIFQIVGVLFLKNQTGPVA